MRVTADTSAIELVLAVSSKDLKVKCLVKVAEVIGREVYSDCHLTVGWQNPPEVIQPANDHRTFKERRISSGQGQTGLLPGRSPGLPGVRHGHPEGPAGSPALSGAQQPHPLFGAPVFPSLGGSEAHLMNFSWENCPEKLFWSMSDRGAMAPGGPPGRPFLLKAMRRLSF